MQKDQIRNIFPFFLFSEGQPGPPRRSRGRPDCLGNILPLLLLCPRKVGRPRSPNLAALCLAGLLALAATVAVAQERPVAPYAAAPAAADSGLTSIEIDEQAGAIRIVIGGRERAIFNDAGLHVTGSIDYTGTLTDLSDLRRKTDIRPLGSALPKIGDLKPVTFRMKDGPAQQEHGLLAQQVEDIYPTLVESRSDDSKGLNYIGLIAPLVAAVQELHADNRTLQEDNLALRDRISALEHSVNALRGEGP